MDDVAKLESDKLLIEGMKKLFLANSTTADLVFDMLNARDSFFTQEIADEWDIFISEYWRDNR